MKNKADGCLPRKLSRCVDDVFIDQPYNKSACSGARKGFESSFFTFFYNKPMRILL